MIATLVKMMPIYDKKLIRAFRPPAGRAPGPRPSALRPFAKFPSFMEVRIYCVSFEIMHKDKRFLKSAIKHLERGFMKEDVANGLYSISRQARGPRAGARGHALLIIRRA